MSKRSILLFLLTCMQLHSYCIMRNRYCWNLEGSWNLYIWLALQKKQTTSLGFPRHILFSIISPEKNTEKWTFTLDFQTSNSSDGITFAYQETPEKFSMHLSGSCVDLLHFGFQPDILCGNRLFTLNTSWYKVLKMPRLLE